MQRGAEPWRIAKGPKTADPSERRKCKVGQIMKRVLIVYHSRTGGSEAMARAAVQGATHELEVILKCAADAGPEDLLTADGYLFACPENLASMSGVMKDFFDRCYYPALGQIEGRPYATMICAGSDGEGTARQMTRIALGWRLKVVADPLIICTHAQTPEAILAAKVIEAAALAKCRELGALFGAGLAMGVF
jgi:NADPH-dependent FMN reductase